MSYTIEEARALFGDRIPKIGHAVPAAWWITTDQTQQDAYDQWVTDYETHREKIETLAQTIGLHAEDAYYSAYAGRASLTGFRAKAEWRRWPSEKGYEPVPTGWRIDSKKGHLVPSRKTKTDREGPVNTAWTAAQSIPHIGGYMTGMPTEIMLDDRDFGGTSYSVQYRRGDNCVAAFSGGDPDRQPERRMNDAIDPIWQRQKLSILIALGEEQAEAAR